ncbi:hypothetical protein EUGRSUZ_I00067 [Eucalyptus grandis]|uniref:Uncharacterized protein n=2 Tax=Eucalyptus grandis TaxID=71139 RepID=A0ACC3JDS8_EUCGR|nr:hypothetical protein EUGRSUZ_I00067 [Eucalyptus grandis]
MEIVARIEDEMNANPIRSKKQVESHSSKEVRVDGKKFQIAKEGSGKQLMYIENSEVEGSKDIGDVGKKAMKNQKAKKHKRVEMSSSSIFEEMELLEIPVQLVKEGKEWVLVISPNKPPKTL